MKPQTHTALSWAAYKADNPKVRIRNAAAELGVSEMELLNSDLSENCIRLKPDILAILEALPSLGNVMALTRNESVVHEVTATFSSMKMRKQTALYLRPGQDTRFFTNQWAYAFAVNEDERRSLQFFDHYGVAVHKVYLVNDSHLDNYLHLVTEFKDATQSHVQPMKAPLAEPKANTAIDVQVLRERWSQIKNVHEGQQIINAHNSHRLNVYEALGNEYAIKLPSSVIESALCSLLEKKAETMVFVSNNSCVQSFAGPVNRLLRTGPWFNVLNDRFNLHLNTEQLSQVWLIKKPSDNGFVHSLNAFDKNNNEVLTMTDNRAKGEQESLLWVELIDILQYEQTSKEDTNEQLKSH
jgi:putative hemin transport protein